MYFFLLLNAKEDILENVGNQTSIVFFSPTMEVSGVHQLFGYQHPSKDLALCFSRINSYRFETT